MTNQTPRHDDSESRKAVIDWLLQADPAIRWQVLRDLADASEEAVAAERARVGVEGWGARLLALQESDGRWDGATYRAPGWTATTDAVGQLRDLGLDPASEPARKAINLVRNVTWGPEFDNKPYFEGEDEPCINGRVLSHGAYFGHASDHLVDRLLGEQLADGGWNCDAPPSTRSSFDTTICVLEGLLEYERAKGATTDVTNARLRAQEYLLERGLFRSLSTGAVIDPHWTRFAFPTHWHYDVLWGLDYLRKARVEPDHRVAEAIALVEQKRDGDGRWPLENRHPGNVHFHMEDGVGQPSRWNTLRALRVLDWYSTRR